MAWPGWEGRSRSHVSRLGRVVEILFRMLALSGVLMFAIGLTVCRLRAGWSVLVGCGLALWVAVEIIWRTICG